MPVSRRRDRRLFVAIAALLSPACTLAFGCPAQARPNIILFLADDLGYGDLGCYGHPIVKTPNIDALAKQGLRLTDCHSAGTVCSPSRAGLLTGRTPYRSGFYTIAGPEGSHLRRSEITVATLLKKRGYDTCFVGKWHLGNIDNPASKQPDPGEHGFDHWFATRVNAFEGPAEPKKFIRNGKKVGPVNQWYCDAIVAEATAALRDGSHTMIGWFDAENRKPGSEWIKSTTLNRFALYDLSRDTAQVHDLSRSEVSTYDRLRTKMDALWASIQSEAPMWKASPKR